MLFNPDLFNPAVFNTGEDEGPDTFSVTGDIASVDVQQDEDGSTITVRLREV